MKTRNQLKKIFQDYAANHLQVYTFGYGQEFEQQAMEGVEYPLLWVIPFQSDVQGVDLNRRFQIIVADRVRKDESNELDVESDTELIILDTLAYLYKYALENGLSLLDGNAINPFWEKWGDEVTGHWVEVSLQDYFDWDSCSLPLADEIPQGQFPDTGGVNISATVFSKSIAIPSPVTSDDIPLFYTWSSIQVRQINDVLAGTNPTLSYNIYFDADKNSLTPTKLWTADRTATDLAGSENEQFDNGVIPANNWVWIKPSAKTGTVEIFGFNIFYKTII